MNYRSYGDLGHESYDSDNLVTCRSCDCEFCYRCSDCGDAVCLRCRDTQRAGQPSA